MKRDKWRKRWQIGKSTGDGYWTVAVDKDGNYGCSCPVWKFRRDRCKHIQYVQANPTLKPNEQTIIKTPDLIPANVLQPVFDEKSNRILYPLVSFQEGPWMEATICWFIMEHGFSWTELKSRRRHIPNSWTKRAVYAYIEEHGPAQYQDHNPHNDITIRQTG